MTPPSPDFHALGERIAREEDALLARPLPRNEATLRARGPASRPRRALLLGALVAFACAAALAAALVMRARPLEVTVSGKVKASGEWISAPPDAPVPVRFSEGTEIVLAPEAHARVAEVTPRGAHLLLESGAAHVSVTPGRGGRWSFTAGPYQVDVKGTRFELAWSPREQLLTLELVEGSVLISGCALGEGRALFAGETLRASCLSNEFRIDRAPSPTAGAPPAPPRTEGPSAPSSAPATDPDGDEPAVGPAAVERAPLRADAPPVGAPPGARVVRAGPSAGEDETWQSLAGASRFKEAFARVNERGFDRELARAGRDDLLLLGDVARLSGNSARALLAYQRVRARAPGTEEAANAAFAMGRVYFDQREAYADAARWFATYRSERSDGPLARDATGRQMEALSRAGDAAAAARVAEEYLRRYPKGPHAPLARTLYPEAN
jgi:transmembrane sensor